MATILGIGGSDHDVHACLIRDGRVLIAVEDERLSRKKYGLGGNLLEGLSRRCCLERAGLSMDDVDQVILDAILAPTAALACRSRARRLDHHLAHAAAAYFTSGFDSAAVLVVDNAGGMVVDRGDEALQATSWYHAVDRDLRLVDRVTSRNWRQGPLVRGQAYQRGDGDDSLGHLYKKFTGALGFRFPRGSQADEFYFPEDGITMGLAAYGDARFVDPLWSLVELGAGGRYRICLTDGRVDALLAQWLSTDAFEVRAAVAFAVQEVLTRTLCHVVEHVVAVTGERRLCLSGGVAMNSVMNGRILRETSVTQLFVPPIPGDNGTGIGAALWAATRDRGAPVPTYSVYSGPTYSDAEIQAALQAADLDGFEVREHERAELIEGVARQLAGGEIIAWFEGGSEGGRRALGHRSILSDPRTAEQRDRLNARVKRREWFRPFAPVVPEERVHEFFDFHGPSPYMQIVCDVRPERRTQLAGITHSDGTARLQTLRRDEHARLYDVLCAFGEQTGAPVLLNTSFNIAGEPMVESPADALRCFQGSQIDSLVLESYWVVRRCRA